MTAAPRARGDERVLLRQAAGGDEHAFRELVEPYRAQLLAGEKISAVTAFLTADPAGVPRDGAQESSEEFFARFGLPAELA